MTCVNVLTSRSPANRDFRTGCRAFLKIVESRVRVRVSPFVKVPRYGLVLGRQRRRPEGGQEGLLLALGPFQVQNLRVLELAPRSADTPDPAASIACAQERPDATR